MMCGKCLIDTIPDANTMKEFCPQCGEIISYEEWASGSYIETHPQIAIENLRRMFAFSKAVNKDVPQRWS